VKSQLASSLFLSERVTVLVTPPWLGLRSIL
jgi:hypothetical protein